MKPQQTRARVRLLAMTLLAAIALLFVYRLLTTEPPAATPGVPTQRPTDLGANLVTHEAFPSLSYGIQAFLWWSETTRDRDLELVRQLRFDYVKQIFDWNDTHPEKDRPYDWGHADLIVGEA